MIVYVENPMKPKKRNTTKEQERSQHKSSGYTPPPAQSQLNLMYQQQLENISKPHHLVAPKEGNFNEIHIYVLYMEY